MKRKQDFETILQGAEGQRSGGEKGGGEKGDQARRKRGSRTVETKNSQAKRGLKRAPRESGGGNFTTSWVG